MKTKVIAVFDIGKTNKKILLFDQSFSLVHLKEQKFPTTIDEDGCECDDIQLITDWMQQTLSSLVLEGRFEIQAINFSTYGASLAYLNDKGELLTPIYNYLKEVNLEIESDLFLNNGGVEEFCRRTASPSLGVLLNSGVQLLWLKQEKPEIWNQVSEILHFPQYLSYVLTKKVFSEPTSIGCHTFMWDFDAMKYHPWLCDHQIALPEPVENAVCYPATIQGEEILTGVGIHDSSASLVPYLQKSDDEFILVSTGTWCITMNPYNSEPLTDLQLKNDCLCFLTPEKQQVKSSRLFMGHFHEKCVGALNNYFGIEENYYKSIPYNAEVISNLTSKMGDLFCFFPLGTNHFEDGFDEIDLTAFENYDEAYTRLVFELTRLCIRSVEFVIPQNDQTKKIYVSGGFSRNPIFIELLSNHFADKTVTTSEIDNASALGAAMVVAGNVDGYLIETISLESKNKQLSHGCV